MKKVVIWTFRTCPFCIKAKALLDELQIEYEDIEIPFGDSRLKTLEEKTGCGTLPQIFIDDVFIGDSSKLFDLNDQGLLIGMLKE